VGGGGFVFAFDAADLTENIEHELPIGATVGVDPAETVEQIRKLKRIARERGYRLVPGHDPVVWPALTSELQTRFATHHHRLTGATSLTGTLAAHHHLTGAMPLTSEGP
jgi:glyoxylase-like metal-dependent hydrolase (beta-lactamase superfamily II)